jgi:cytochrome c peroxidase
MRIPTTMIFCTLPTIFFTALLLAPAPVFAFDYYQALPKKPLLRADNPQTDAKIKLGKQLFYDKRLSGTQTYSCNDCHNLLTGGDDDRAFSIGPNGQPTRRSAPGLWNIGLQTVLYWDGRATTLELQGQDHLLDTDLMANDNAGDLVKRVAAIPNYQQAFEAVFGKGKHEADHSISLVTISKALASFERSLMAYNSPFDRYLNGDENAISALAKKGKVEFQNAGCIACHFGANFAGPAPGPYLNKMGDGFYELFPTFKGTQYEKPLHITDDPGRIGFTKLPNEKYMWRVPPLRNIALTAPYFHNGSVKTLRKAVKVMGKTQFNFDLTEEQIDAIVAFLNTLTGETPSVLRSQ